MDKDQVSGLVFVDYKKAFGLIDHEILLSKLEAYGKTSKELMLLTNYLKRRGSSVVIGSAVQTDHTWCSARIGPGATASSSSL